MTKKDFTGILSILALILIPGSQLNAQYDPDLLYSDSIVVFEDFFGKEDPLHLTLEFDLKSMQKNRMKEEYVPAKMIYKRGDSLHFSFPVKIKTRGTFRKSFCYFPPFWINITNSGINTDAMYGVKKMKVVTHCMKTRDYQDYVLKEYLAYKIYNIISPYSFRVRLLRIKYVDTGRNNNIQEGWAFVIEPVELLAKRLDARIIENDKLSMARMNAGIMDKLAMYYYMMGNTDFSVTGLHNIKIILLNNPGPVGYIPVPYDFDYTGFVNTTYAKPADNVNLEKVTDRYFLGPCRSDEVFQRLTDEFKGSYKEMQDLLQSFEYLSVEKKIELLRFMEEFHSEIESADFIQARLRPACK